MQATLPKWGHRLVSAPIPVGNSKLATQDLIQAGRLRTEMTDLAAVLPSCVVEPSQARSCYAVRLVEVEEVG